MLQLSKWRTIHIIYDTSKLLVHLPLPPPHPVPSPIEQQHPEPEQQEPPTQY